MSQAYGVHCTVTKKNMQLSAGVEISCIESTENLMIQVDDSAE